MRAWVILLKSSFFRIVGSRLFVCNQPSCDVNASLCQQVKIVPVGHWLEGIAMAKAAMAAQNQDRAFHSVSFPLWGRGGFLFWKNPESVLDFPD